ncbi:MAG TPA: hypothetical protein VK636_17915 [Gemmatimonadaceae bacterium]|nr:hypothetical protein [Gemmatimonadaceae bacterium]
MTPDTQGTFIAGYVAATIIYVGYTLTLWLRGRRVRERLDARRRL